jgi:alpha-mannosidase
VLLLFDCGSEALIWSTDGTPLQALIGVNNYDDRRHIDYKLTDNAKKGEFFEFYIEMACNGISGAGTNGGINAPDPNQSFKLELVEIVSRNQVPYELYRDFQVYIGLIKVIYSVSIQKVFAFRFSASG